MRRKDALSMKISKSGVLKKNLSRRELLSYNLNFYIFELLCPVRLVNPDKVQSGIIDPRDEGGRRLPNIGKAARIDERALLACARETNYELADLNILDVCWVPRQLPVV
jgi:hypothetical protein